jgi:hypothetical protein
MSTAPTFVEQHNVIERAALAVQAGGGIYKGIFEGIIRKDGTRTEDLVLFDSPATRSTLALPLPAITPEAVAQHIAQSNAKFGIKDGDK